MQALLKAYDGDVSKMPEDVRGLVDKVDTENAKQLTKGLHTATTKLGLAKKALDQAVEARKHHRQQWLRHMEEATKMWETQLAEYRARQAKLQEEAMQATAEVTSARRQIQSLNVQSGGKTLPPVDIEDAEDATKEQDPDLEEQQLRQRLVDLLTACISTDNVGPIAPVKPEAVKVDSDDEDLCEETEQEKEKKRKLAAAAGNAPS